MNISRKQQNEVGPDRRAKGAKSSRQNHPIKLLSIDRWILISIVALAVLACRMLLKSPGSKEAALIYEQAHTILPPLAM
jgi:hypothetical protein